MNNSLQSIIFSLYENIKDQEYLFSNHKYLLGIKKEFNLVKLELFEIESEKVVVKGQQELFKELAITYCTWVDDKTIKAQLINEILANIFLTMSEVRIAKMSKKI